MAGNHEPPRFDGPDPIERAAMQIINDPGTVHVPMSVTHHFAEGVYMREFHAPGAQPDKGLEATLVVGHRHRGEHYNIITKGHVLVMMDGKKHEFFAGAIFKSNAGVRKVLLVLEDLVWITVHANPANERNIDVLEQDIIQESDAVIQHTLERAQRELQGANAITEVTP